MQMVAIGTLRHSPRRTILVVIDPIETYACFAVSAAPLSDNALLCQNSYTPA
jgi:hypothetical protein